MNDRDHGAVGALMSAPVVTAGPADSLAAAAAAMVARGVGSVVVVDASRPVGILTERDLLRAAAARIDPSAATVAAWMTPDPEVAGPGERVTTAFDTLAERGYRHIPIVEDGLLVGIVSLRDLVRLAQTRPVTPPGTIDAPKGLAGVVVAETEVGDVRGQEGFYHYRQYSAVELAEQRTLDDVWHLLLLGELPTRAERAAFLDRVGPLRAVPPAAGEQLPAIAAAGETFILLDALRTALSLVAAELGFRPVLDQSHDELLDAALRVCAVVPTLIAALWRLRQGLQPVESHPDLPSSANYLSMLTGEIPDPEHARAVEQYLITTVDHGFNASTFTARVIASTGADLGSCVVGAIGALSGPLHGGAPSRALDLLDAIGTADRADAHIRDAVERGGRIMGFGHRVYKTEDPRSRLLRGVAQRLGGPKADLAIQVEQTVVDVLAELKPGRQLYANVEFYAGVVMDRCGIPRELFTPTFTASRVIGWCANILEQAADNRIIRPSARYVGPPPPQPVPPAA